MIVTVVATGFGAHPAAAIPVKKVEEVKADDAVVAEEVAPKQEFGTSDEDLSDIFDMFKSRK